MITLIKNGEVYGPDSKGQQSVLLIGDKIAQIGDVNEQSLLDSGLEVQVIDVGGSIVTPGLIDPHVHLMGGGGEGGFSTRTPETQLTDMTTAGITTVVGCLGTDGTTRHPTSLLAKAKGLDEEGITTYIYTGNYHVPTTTIMSSVKDDILLIDKVIGAGEIAISDSRSAQPSAHEIAKLVAEARIGGLLSNKAGVTHFHVGPGKERLALLHQILEDYEIVSSNIYATHITRSRELVDDAIALAQKGAYVDMTVHEETAQWIRYFNEKDGNLRQLTLSSDGNGSLPKFDEEGNLMGVGVASPYTLYEQVVNGVKASTLPLQSILSLVTANTADALKLEQKGRLEKGKDADVLVMDKDTLEIQHVLAKGSVMVQDGKPERKGTYEK